MTQHIETRRKLKELSLVSEFEDILSKCMIHDDDKEILRMYYINGKSIGYISDIVGYTPREVIEKHRKALKKIAKAL